MKRMDGDWNRTETRWLAIHPAECTSSCLLCELVKINSFAFFSFLVWYNEQLGGPSCFVWCRKYGVVKWCDPQKGGGCTNVNDTPLRLITVITCLAVSVIAITLLKWRENWPTGHDSNIDSFDWILPDFCWNICFAGHSCELTICRIFYFLLSLVFYFFYLIISNIIGTVRETHPPGYLLRPSGLLFDFLITPPLFLCLCTTSHWESFTLHLYIAEGIQGGGKIVIDLVLLSVFLFLLLRCVILGCSFQTVCADGKHTHTHGNKKGKRSNKNVIRLFCERPCTFACSLADFLFTLFVFCHPRSPVFFLWNARFCVLQLQVYILDVIVLNKFDSAWVHLYPRRSNNIFLVPMPSIFRERKDGYSCRIRNWFDRWRGWMFVTKLIQPAHVCVELLRIATLFKILLLISLTRFVWYPIAMLSCT